MSVPSCFRPTPIDRGIGSALTLLSLAALTACGPVYRARAESGQPGAAIGAAARPAPSTAATAEADPRRLLGTWALTDNDNLLFNIPLRPDGTAQTAAGNRDTRSEDAGRLTEKELIEVGR